MELNCSFTKKKKKRKKEPHFGALASHKAGNHF